MTRNNSLAAKQVVEYRESVENPGEKSKATTSACSLLTQAGSTFRMLSLMDQTSRPNAIVPAENKFVEIDLNDAPKPKEATPVVSRGARAKKAIQNAGIQLKRMIGKIGSFITTAASTIVDTFMQALNFCVKIPLLPLYMFNKVYAVAFKVDKTELSKSKSTERLQLHRVDTGRLAVFGSARQSMQSTPRSVHESLQQPAVPEVSEDDLKEEQHLEQGQPSSLAPG